AAAQMVKAVAEERGWEHKTHADLYRAVARVAEELADSRVQNLFRSASALHQNFYEDDMPETTVATRLDDAEEIADLLASVID
ncbi:MAG: hypothetical protein OXI03_02385, partial [Chloroflexota bacterium]|nr:hypothetical protein [Chloroflexota bacterium]